MTYPSSANKFLSHKNREDITPPVVEEVQHVEIELQAKFGVVDPVLQFIVQAQYQPLLILLQHLKGPGN